MINERIKKIRELKGLTQPKLAEIMGVTLPRVRNLENRGANSLTENEIINLKNRLCLSVEWIVTGKGDMFATERHGGAVNQHLMRRIIIDVESALDQYPKVKVSPEQKAELIMLFYNEYINEIAADEKIESIFDAMDKSISIAIKSRSAIS